MSNGWYYYPRPGLREYGVMPDTMSFEDLQSDVKAKPSRAYCMSQWCDKSLSGKGVFKAKHFEGLCPDCRHHVKFK